MMQGRTGMLLLRSFATAKPKRSQNVLMRHNIAVPSHRSTEVMFQKHWSYGISSCSNGSCRFLQTKSFPLRLSEKSPSTSPTTTRPVTATTTSQSSEISRPPLPPKKRRPVSAYLFTRFFSFVESYPAKLEKNFPGAMHVYRVFVVGFKDFSRELGDYVRVSRKVLLSSSRALTSSELELYYRMPKEILRVAPTLLISALPFMNYVMFPVAYYFPKSLLSSHFWSIQQKAQFTQEGALKRLYNLRPVLRALQANVVLVRDVELREKAKFVLDKLGSGSHPTVREILDIKVLFEGDPYSISAIYGPHVKALCRLHGMHTIYLKRRRLRERAEMLSLMDASMLSEGIYTLSVEELKRSCYERGLSAANLGKEEMREFLQTWSAVSCAVGTKDAYSLLLHLPVLITYNSKSNWALLSPK